MAIDQRERESTVGVAAGQPPDRRSGAALPARVSRFVTVGATSGVQRARPAAADHQTPQWVQRLDASTGALVDIVMCTGNGIGTSHNWPVLLQTVRIRFAYPIGCCRP
jgi:hypothetical protein